MVKPFNTKNKKKLSSGPPFPPATHGANEHAKEVAAAMTSSSRPGTTYRADSKTHITANSALNDGRTSLKPVEVAEAQQKQAPRSGAGRDNSETGLSIYARPFVPEILTVINTLPPREVQSTPPRKAINFADFIGMSFGLFARSLPSLPMPALDYLTESSSRSSIRDPKEYEDFFQFHLREETQAQQTQNEAYSLYGQEVTIQPYSLDFQSFQSQGETICLLRVPGIRENSPLIEDDDVVYLRRLIYGQDGSPLLMREWLECTKVKTHTSSVPHQRHMFRKDDPAPGWTSVLYAARVLSVSRPNELLILRVKGLPSVGLASGRVERFNVQFPYPVDRYLPMQYALPNVRRGLSQLREYQGPRDGQEDGGTSQLADPKIEQPVHWIQSMLFPTLGDSKMQENLHAGHFRQNFFDQVLNWEQKKAVEAVCEGKYGKLPYLISGPPGTGKTKTIIETALQLLKNTSAHGHILMCAPSDPAADTLVQRLRQHLNTSEMLRMNRPGRTFAEVPGAVLPYCSIENDTFTLPAFQELMKYRVVVTTCRDSSLLAQARTTNADLYTMENALRNLTRYDVLPSFPSQLLVHFHRLTRSFPRCRRPLHAAHDTNRFFVF